MTDLVTQPSTPISYQEARAQKEESIWNSLGDVSVSEAAAEFLAKILNLNTRKNYKSGMRQLADFGFINPMESLQVFALRKHESNLDGIKSVEKWSEASRQVRAALYCAFTRFLFRKSEGVIRRAIPSREGTTKTFFKVREIVSTRSMNKVQWTKFLTELDKINKRDGLIARIMLQGGKRKSEVLSLQTDQIDWDEGTIAFKQTKTRGTAKITVITYPPHVMSSLQGYLARRKGQVFVTSSGKPVQSTQIDRSFRKAGERARIQFPISPYVLRTSAVTYYKGNGYSDTDIMKVTGHATANMVAMYDRAQLGENASRKESLV